VIFVYKNLSQGTLSIMFQKIAPILPALNIAKTNLFYRDKLKFNTINYGNYLVVQKENIEIHFSEQPDPKLFNKQSCYIFVQNIEDLFVYFSSLEVVSPTEKLQERFPNMKEFSIVDNNGNVLRFGERRG